MASSDAESFYGFTSDSDIGDESSEDDDIDEEEESDFTDDDGSFASSSQRHNVPGNFASSSKRCESCSSCASCGPEKNPNKRKSKVDKDNETKDIIFSNMREQNATTFKTRGSRPRELQQALDNTTRFIFSRNNTNIDSCVRLTGFPRTAVESAVHSHSTSESPAGMFQPRKRSKRQTAADTDFLYELIHTKCPLVELDRSKKGRWKKKKIRVGEGGQIRHANCMQHVRSATKDEIVDWVLQSEEIASYMKNNPDVRVSRQCIRNCICPCISAAKTAECACPICFDFRSRLKVFNDSMVNIRKEHPCTCCTADSPFVKSTKSSTLFSQNVCCDKEKCPGLEMPHNQDFTPSFYPLRCVINEATKPHDNTRPCSKCGLEKIIPKSCPNFSRDVMMATTTWQKRDKVKYRNKRGKWFEKDVLHDHTGTIGELWDEIQGRHKFFMYHRWLVDWQRWAFKREIATFDGEEEILVLCDFAAQFKMHGVATKTCEMGQTCNEYVCLVLYKPSQGPVAQTERNVLCDYIRIWSSVGSSPNFHHEALHDIRLRYKTKARVPGLKRIKVWSDGDRTSYKGHSQFGRQAHWPQPSVPKKEQRPGEEDCCGMEILHRTFPSHHACGPQDNAGKDPRIGMERDIGFSRASNIYDYHQCLEWCKSNMREPSKHHRHDGTWGCNGEFVWMAYSDGAQEDEHRNKYPHLDMRYKKYQPIKGSNELYAFDATDKSQPLMEARFVLCTCAACISRNFDSCYFAHIAGPVKNHSCHHLETETLSKTNLRRTTSREARQVRLENA